MAYWQQAVALDARFNALRAPATPGYRTLYIRRRTQLLNEKGRTEEKGCSNYIQIRLALLQQRYGVSSDQLSTKSRSTSVRSTSRQAGLEMDAASISFPSSLQSQNLKSPPPPTPGEVIPTYRADASRAIVGGTTIGENYAFSGFHHIFDQHKDSVTMVKFAHNNPGLLGCCSLDGLLTICEICEGEPRVVHTLNHHSAGVSGFDWSCTNDVLASGGHDGQVCLWSSSSGQCLRTVKDQSSAQILSCVFHPLNSNWIVCGNSVGLVQVLNVSTGLYPVGGTSTLPGAVTALAFEADGNLLWAGDSKGLITSFAFDASGCLRKGKKMMVKEGSAITSLNARTWANREARDPSLLVNCACNLLLLYRVVDSSGTLRLKNSFKISHVKHPIKSAFSPLMSFRQGSCVVSGSEDCSVWFFDIERETKPLINRLQGHSAPVLSVSFNYDESFLASSDAAGLVIVWKRQRKGGDL